MKFISVNLIWDDQKIIIRKDDIKSVEKDSYYPDDSFPPEECTKITLIDSKIYRSTLAFEAFERILGA